MYDLPISGTANRNSDVCQAAAEDRAELSVHVSSISNVSHANSLSKPPQPAVCITTRKNEVVETRTDEPAAEYTKFAPSDEAK